ncbi:metal dependent phosphohydrolase [Saccharopolyspora shandongensis]|uniref:Metal dependent phosphohydrolase n=1 Tax=Saccharopolyspora shandongensis TaxID=418495 RepID=A0A1H3U2H2_9PSEU|nr:HD domain-containing protein [Saccharopolyspora shandongensis]SDZ56542.1 metal dependent phosphohydrolase [Saccharopolyspora shandongensis]
MLPLQYAGENQYGRDVTDCIPSAVEVPGLAELSAHHDAIWQLAAPHLAVRNNDEHTIYAYGIARALADAHPDADPEVVLPAILLHDTGWSKVPADEVLTAIAPGRGRPDLVLLHEKEGAEIAGQVLRQVQHDAARAASIIDIIDGHDSRKQALSLDDALVKDADKLWRLTPHGVDTIMNWFGLDRRAALRLIGSRVQDHLFTDTARTMARILAAVAWVDSSPQRVALG